ncbi:NO-inducible flavohemoprotein [Pantoea sp. Mb-10]|uniref:NO-inducible flavohemoprotein n=1 Tax=unclassified Pantoea TaxID=2630326 RepID=UPI001E4A7CEB|nr:MULTISPECIES: NO-inducible flavohemoprotein [unclassified Pantoea]MCE0489167.1 NO-inducible flavohemoprotein [Pantoea sp. Mb-10]MCE0503084.1 NO-inducible flavohemoprotein [Pantoea sp. Pb-8]
MLDAQTIATVKASLPAVAALGPQLTGCFYQRLLQENPALKNVFNMNNQRSGSQREALFNAIAAYASNLDNLSALLPAVEKIAQKHASLNIQPDQYAIVGSTLLATLEEMLDPGDDVLQAWGKAYAVLAEVFIQREAAIYQSSEDKAGGWRGLRDFRIHTIRQESSVIKSIELIPCDGLPIADYLPGQYLTLTLRPTGSEYLQHRQYSLTRLPNGISYRIAVKRDMLGSVSNWLHVCAKAGDVVQCAVPAGDFTLKVEPNTPVTFISAGVGQTPLLAMLASLAHQHHAGAVTWLHATETGAQHAFATEVETLGVQLPRFSRHVWYRTPDESDAGCYERTGLMELSVVAEELTQPDRTFWLCGPLPFMQFVARQLLDAGVSGDRIHYEVFGPHKVL